MYVNCPATLKNKNAIVRCISGEICSLTFEVLSQQHINEILHVQHLVTQRLKDTAFYSAGTKDIFIDCLSGNGLIIGAFVCDKLIGFRSIWFPKSNAENLGKDVGIEDSSLLSKVAHLERSCVLPEFSGNRLQLQMTEHALNIGRLERQFSYLLATVHPLNYASLLDKFAISMVISKFAKKYGGNNRYIFFKNLLSDEIKINSMVPRCYIESKNQVAIKQILAPNGIHQFVGIQMFKNTTQFIIEFGALKDGIF